MRIAYPFRISCFQAVFHKQIAVLQAKQAQRQQGGQQAAPGQAKAARQPTARVLHQ